MNELLARIVMFFCGGFFVIGSFCQGWYRAKGDDFASFLSTSLWVLSVILAGVLLIDSICKSNPEDKRQ